MVTHLVYTLTNSFRITADELTPGVWGKEMKCCQMTRIGARTIQ